jgi:hypothetical protein
MAKAKKSKSDKARWELPAWVWRVGMYVLLLAALGGGMLFGLRQLTRHVGQLAFRPEPPRVVLMTRPAWMSDFLVKQLSDMARPKGSSSALDGRVVQEIHDMLSASPWVKQVRSVRRAYGEQPGDVILVDCDFHTPVALVQRGERFHLVDADGVLLPDYYTSDMVPQIVYGRDGRTTIRVIEGVWSDPPRPGRTWPGADLRAGLDLARLLHGRPYAEELLKIDVSNFEGRVTPREAQLVLVTRHGTEVRWGRPVNARDFFVEVPVARKLEYMQQVHAQFGRVDGNWPWIDIRFDQITYPSESRSARIGGR